MWFVGNEALDNPWFIEHLRQGVAVDIYSQNSTATYYIN